MITQGEVQDRLQVSLSSVKRIMKELQDKNIIEHQGSKRKGCWVIK